MGKKFFGPLTDREKEVLQLAAEGKCIKAQSRAMGIEPNTVKVHRRSAMQKLGTHCITHAVVEALKANVITVEGISSNV